MIRKQIKVIGENLYKFKVKEKVEELCFKNKIFILIFSAQNDFYLYYKKKFIIINNEEKVFLKKKLKPIIAKIKRNKIKKEKERQKKLMHKISKLFNDKK